MILLWKWTNYKEEFNFRVLVSALIISSWFLYHIRAIEYHKVQDERWTSYKLSGWQHTNSAATVRIIIFCNLLILSLSLTTLYNACVDLRDFEVYLSHQIKVDVYLSIY
jgi:heme O synthase-like polyprenyltransferase